MTAAAATLTLSRTWGGFDSRTWQIIIDGKVAGSIGKNQTVEFPVDPGRHTIRLTSSRRLASPQRSFEVADGSAVAFTCHAARYWPRMLASLVKNDLWITLRQ